MRPELWTVPVACLFEQAQTLLTCGLALEVAYRALGSWRFALRTALVAGVCVLTGASVNFLPPSPNSCMRELIAWSLVAFGVVTEVRLAIIAERVSIDQISNVSTRALSWIWACALLYRGVKELNRMDGEFFGFVQTFVYVWAMIVIARSSGCFRSPSHET
jgi:hypothetical protein